MIATVPLILLAGVTWNQARVDLEKSLHARNVALAQKVASDTEVLFTGIVEKLVLVGATSEVTGAQNWEDLLYPILFKTPYLENLAVFDRRGHGLAAVSRRQVKPEPWPKDFPKTMEFQRVARGEVVFGPVRFEEDGRPLMDILVPFPPSDPRLGRPGGFLATVSLRGLWHGISRLTPGHRVSIYLVDSSGTLIAHSDFSQVLEGREVRGSQAVADLLAGRSGKDGYEPKRYVSYQGQEVLGLSLPVPGLGWGVVVEEPVETALAPIRALAWKLTAVTIFVALLVGLLAGVFSVRLTAPLEKLFAGIKRVAAGDYQETLPALGEDEMGRLVASFNLMVAELRKKEETEAALARAEKLAALGVLASGLAHEMNNPLAILAAYTEDLKEYWDGEDLSPEQRAQLSRYFSVVSKQVGRCKAITKNLLDLSRPEPALTEAMALGPVLEEAFRDVEPRVVRQGVRLVVDPGVRELEVMANRRYLLQVLSNLLNNALDALEEQVDPTLQVAGSCQEAEVELVLADNGPGLEEETKAHLFEPFYTTKPPGKGTGLGLFVAYQLTKKMGGDIFLENAPAGGTVVRLRLPSALAGNFRIAEERG